MTESWLEAVWAAPPWVRAGTSTRRGGVSAAPYDSLNLARHVDDDPEAVTRNRRRLRRCCQLPEEPLWLQQSHGNRVLEVDSAAPAATADAGFSRSRGRVCAVLTADCVPLLLCDRDGRRVAAVHVGWRGFCAGIVENALRRLGPAPSGLLAWLGPHICGDCYEVGDEVRAACLRHLATGAAAFRRNARGRWQCSLATLIERVLADHDADIKHSGYCTFEETGLFYSHRRQRPTGRMASLIWMDKTVI
jgi:YfiH family protein